MATFIADKISTDIQLWVSLVGLAGVIVGALITVAGNIILYKLQEHKKNSNDLARKALLKKMLDNKKFKDGRSFEALSTVTGANPEDCRRLLIELKARGFTMSDDREGWTYIKNRPLNEL